MRRKVWVKGVHCEENLREADAQQAREAVQRRRGPGLGPGLTVFSVPDKTAGTQPPAGAFRQFLEQGTAMKKVYEKPTLNKRGKLSDVVAVKSSGPVV